MPALAAEKDLESDKEAMATGLSSRSLLSFDEINGEKRVFSCLKVPLRSWTARREYSA